MQEKVAETGPMTIEDFLDFYEQRPTDEKWELIEGVPVMSSSPSDWHQVIAGNIIAALAKGKEASSVPWVPALGVSTRVPVSPNSLPEPDVMVFGHPLAARRPIVDEAVALFEVLSESCTRKDRDWRRRVYGSVPNCRHYVTVDSRTVAAVRYDRDGAWEAGAELGALTDMLALPALAITIRLTDLYRWTPLGEPAA